MTQRVSYSSITEHRRCPTAWRYKYLENLRKTGDNIPASFGSWWHALKAAQYISNELVYYPEYLRIDDIEISTEGITTEVVLDRAEQFWNSLSDDSQEDWEKVIGDTLEYRLEEMLRRYSVQWEDADKDHQPIAVEVPVKVKLPNTDTVLRGQVDYLYLDNSKGGILVARDIKTSKRLASSESMTDVLDSQLHLYAYALLPFLKKYDLPSLTAVEYDRVRSVMPVSPVLTASGLLSQSVKSYDLHTYLEWTVDPIGWGVPDTYTAAGKPKFGTYHRDQKVVDRLSSPEEIGQWFRRTLIPVNRNVIRHHVKSAVMTAESMEQSREADPDQLARNFSKNCEWCDYAKLCRAEVMGGVDGDYDLSDLGLTRIS